jgi:hypothetical protein
VKSNKFRLFFISLLFTISVVAKEYHVSDKNGSDTNNGSFESPFKTISAAVKYAFPGDVITVHEGTYREWINPIRGGESDSTRIVYRAAPGEKVQIKGSEIITGWEKVKNGVWKVTIDNSFFKDYNPYKDEIYGDWFRDLGRIHHTGEVFLNGKSFYEKEAIEKVFNSTPDQSKQDIEGSAYTWFCESNDESTTIWANFQKFNPNKELVEISTRRTVFYPEKQGINFITLRGFHISQAATQWGAPTAEQIGMIATHWNKGWIIENNVISDSKCSGITLGKERTTGHNVWSADKGSINNDGNIHYIEVTFNTLRHSWNKATVGSHIVRNNIIYNCEQTGICGSMGAAFSTIENNHIYNIWTKRQFDGAEIGGIKFHAAIDAIIKKNRIHNSARGIWLDWMTQGTRVSSNLLYNNIHHDLFLEVNHGPFMVDNNIMLSEIGIDTQSEGGAFVHNLVAGKLRVRSDLRRFTPYHLPHSTAIKGLTIIQSGDDRYYNNIFIGKGNTIDNKESYGLQLYKNTKYPGSINNNFYYNGAIPYVDEMNSIVAKDYNPGIRLEEIGSEVFIHYNFDDAYRNFRGGLITTKMLGTTVIAKAKFENPDGSPLLINKDYFGNSRTEKNNLAGPFNSFTKDNLKLKVW